jgi:hypothetical protein
VTVFGVCGPTVLQLLTDMNTYPRDLIGLKEGLTNSSTLFNYLIDMLTAYLTT